MRLATAYMEITVKDAVFRKAMRESKISLTRFTSGASKVLGGVTKAMKALGIATGVVSAAFTVLAVQTTRAFARLQNNMARVSTMIQKDWQKTTAVLSKGVRQLSLDIPQTTKELTAALYDILSAGVPAARSLEMLGVAGKAAVAGVSDVNTASRLLTGTINGMGLALDSMQEVSDLAFSTVERGVITFAELSASIGRSMSGANKLKASVQELYGSMAFLTKQNLSAEMSATALGATYDELSAKSTKLAKLGVRVFGEEGEYRGILAVMEDISAQLSGLTQQAKTNVLEEMGFERQAARAIVAMTTNLKEFRTTMVNVADSAGATEAAYAKMKDTLINQWTILKNSVSNLATVIGKSLGEAALKAIKKAKEIVDGIATMIEGAGGLNNLWKEHGDVVKDIFKEMATAAINITGVMLINLGKLIAAGAPLMWTPIWHNLKNVNMRVASELQKLGATVMEHYGLYTKLQKDLRMAEIDADVLQWVTDADIANTAEMEKLMSELVGTMGEINIGTWDVLKESITGISTALIKAIEEVKEFNKEVTGIIAPAPAAAEPVRVWTMPNLGEVKATISKAGNLWKDFYGNLRTLSKDTYSDVRIMAIRTAYDIRDAKLKALQEETDKGFITQAEARIKRVAAEQELDDFLWALRERNAKENEERIAGFRRDISNSVIDDMLEADKERRDEELEKSIAHATKITELWDFVAETISSSLENMFTDVLSGNLKTWEDFFQSLWNIAKREIARFGAMQIGKAIRGLLPGGEKPAVLGLRTAASELAIATTALVPATVALSGAAGSLLSAAAILAGTGVLAGGGGGGTDSLGTAQEALEEIGEELSGGGGCSVGSSYSASAPARRMGGLGVKGGDAFIFKGDINITGADLETMSQAKINSLFERKFIPAMRNAAHKGKINKSMVG